MVLILSEVGSSERLHQTYLFWQEFYRNKFTLTGLLPQPEGIHREGANLAT
jgi:hypothetical protein